MKDSTADNTLEKQDFNLFEALVAIDKKDYGYYDRLLPEQQKKFVPYLLIQWISAVKANHSIQEYYLQSTEYHSNKYLFNENVQKHPKLVWLTLCAASPGLGKQFHFWIPHIRERVSKLKENAKPKEIKEYYKKIYPKSSIDDINIISEAFIDNHQKRMYIGTEFPTLKYDEIELLAELVSNEEIADHKRYSGN